MPKVSVIVPIYKVEKYLCQCIDSILNQTLKDIEVILVDEGDLDACRAIIDMYEFGAKKDSRVKSIHEKNGGYGASVNKGMDLATGEYISIIESDDFIAPEMFEEMYNYAKKLDADVVKTPFYNYFDASKKSPERSVIFDHAQAIADYVPKDCTFSVIDYPDILAYHASVWSAIYKTLYLRENDIKFVEPKRGGGAYVDVGFRALTCIKTDKYAWLDKPFYYYRRTNMDCTANNFNLDAMLTRWEEVHEYFADKKELYNKIISGWLRDLYLNSANRINAKTSENDIERIINLYNFIPIEAIKNSNVCNKYEKKLILSLREGLRDKNELIRIKNRTIKAKYVTIYKISLFGLPLLKIKRKRNDRWKLLLFWFLPIGRIVKQ